MPIKLRYTSDGKGVVYEASGPFSGKELIDANSEVMSRDLVADPLLYIFVDGNGITGVNVLTSDLREIADQDISASKRMQNRPTVAIYAHADLPYALARMWMVFVEAAGWETKVFRDKGEALAWLKERVAANFGGDIDVAIPDAIP